MLKSSVSAITTLAAPLVGAQGTGAGDLGSVEGGQSMSHIRSSDMMLQQQNPRPSCMQLLGKCCACGHHSTTGAVSYFSTSLAGIDGALSPGPSSSSLPIGLAVMAKHHKSSGSSVRGLLVFCLKLLHPFFLGGCQ